MIPNWHYRQRVPNSTNGQICDKEKEVAIIVLSETIVDPWAVMIHRKHALIAHLTMRCSSRLYLVANLAWSLPYLFQIFSCLVSVLHDRLYLAWYALESALWPHIAVLHTFGLRRAATFFFDGFVNLTIWTILYRLSQFFDLLMNTRTNTKVSIKSRIDAIHASSSASLPKFLKLTMRSLGLPGFRHMASRWFQTTLYVITIPIRVQMTAKFVPTRLRSTVAMIVRNTHVWYSIR